MPEDALVAFRPEWERLGDVAVRLGLRSGQQLTKPAGQLRDRGLIESRLNGPCLEWRLKVDRQDEPNEELRPPPKLTPYCPPVELEGPDSGLVEQMAQRLWRKAAEYSPKGKALPVDATWDSRPDSVKLAWREVAYDALLMLFDIGFVGPAGHPDPKRFEGLNYCWNYIAAEWQINDSDGGYIALVRETPDLEIMLAAPKMRQAIKDLLGIVPPSHPWRQRPELQALERSLPESQPA